MKKFKRKERCVMKNIWNESGDKYFVEKYLQSQISFSWDKTRKNDLFISSENWESI